MGVNLDKNSDKDAFNIKTPIGFSSKSAVCKIHIFVNWHKL